MFGESGYGSSGGSSVNSASSWNSRDSWPTQPMQRSSVPEGMVPEGMVQKRSVSFYDLLSGRLENVMQEFQQNGVDSPYEPEDIWSYKEFKNELSGMGPPRNYLRQQSWPAPSPAQPLPASSPPASGPRLRADWSTLEPSSAPATKLHADWETLASSMQEPVTPNSVPSATPKQMQVLQSIPQSVWKMMFKQLQHLQATMMSQTPTATTHSSEFQECRFCKNNGEHDHYYRSHTLKDSRGRVSCPVLRAYVCKHCGAYGDNAHTIKYCPLISHEERQKCDARMKSLRGRRRQSAPSNVTCLNLGNRPNFSQYDVIDSFKNGSIDGVAVPLDPAWVLLEKKLSEL